MINKKIEKNQQSRQKWMESVVKAEQAVRKLPIVKSKHSKIFNDQSFIPKSLFGRSINEKSDLNSSFISYDGDDDYKMDSKLLFDDL